MSVRHVYIVENERGEYTAHVLMRGAKLQAIDVERGNVYRATITTRLSMRELAAALYNRVDFADELVLVYTIDAGNLREPPADQ